MIPVIIWKAMILFILVIGSMYKSNECKELLELKYR
jgi:hypothetical protein